MLVGGSGIARVKMKDRAAMASEALRAYQQRGVFRSIARESKSRRDEVYHIGWHFRQSVIVRIDYELGTVAMEGILPNLGYGDSLYQNLQVFLKSFTSRKTPVHRRVNRRIGVLRSVLKDRSVGIELKLTSSDYEAGTRALVRVVHELYLDFLPNGNYLDYLITQLGLDPDAN